MSTAEKASLSEDRVYVRWRVSFNPIAGGDRSHLPPVRRIFDRKKIRRMVALSIYIKTILLRSPLISEHFHSAKKELKQSLSECEPKCPLGTTFSPCVPSCNSCSSDCEADIEPTICRPGCVCPEGLVLSGLETPYCIDPAQCTCSDHKGNVSLKAF
jgi:hypothetical protein